MRVNNFIAPDEELKVKFSIEWRRAKKLLAPLLNNEKKPKFYVGRHLRRAFANHRGSSLTVWHRINGRKVHSKHIITMSEKHLKRLPSETLRTIRHEICHVIEQNHSARFRMYLHQLDK